MVAELRVVAEPHPGGLGVGQGNPATGAPRRGAREPGLVAAAVVAIGVRRMGWIVRTRAQRGHHQHRDASKSKEVHAGDHQQDELRITCHDKSVSRRGQPVNDVRRYHRSPLMAQSTTTALPVARRDPEGSRAARRLRRTGNVPGVVYGGGEDPVAFQVDSRTLRLALAHAGAVLELNVDGDGGTPVVVKEISRHPVSGHTLHIDLLRVRLDQAIQATVVLELTGADDAPGVKEGGILEQPTRELTVEALPNDIPDSLKHDVSEMVIGDTLTLAAVRAPSNVKLIDDPETVIATLTPPRLQVEEEPEIEEETELVGEGEGEAAAEGEAQDAGGDASGGEGDSADE
jgi:large subunit ribosomal protein L25